jgi:hypothetical protein
MAKMVKEDIMGARQSEFGLGWRGWWAGGLGLLAMAACVLILGCSSDPLSTATSTPNVDQQVAAVRYADSVLQAQSLSLPLRSAGFDSLKANPNFAAGACVEGEIGPDGGQLTLVLDGQDILFSVPAAALTETVNLSICGVKLTTPFGDVFIYECGPSGTTFLKPIVVSQPSNRADGDLSALIYLNLVSGESTVLELQEVVEVKDGTAVLHINHFSMYGIS